MRLYFRVLASSPIMKAIEQYKKELRAHYSGIRKFLKENGFPQKQETWGDSQSLVGLAGRIEKPGWRYVPGKGFSLPTLKTPEGKKLKEQMKNIPIGPSSQSLSEKVFGHGLVIGASHRGLGIGLYHASFAWNKDGVVCVMHPNVKKAAKTWPKGLKEIKGSEAAKIGGTEDE